MRAYYFRLRETSWQTVWVIFFLLASLAFMFSGCKKDDNGDGNGTPAKSVDLRLIADNLVSPLGLEQSPDQSGRLFIFDQTGKVQVIDSNGTLLSTPFLDISNKLVSLNASYDERGLIGFTFHPQFAANGKCYVHYQAPPNPGGPQPGTGWDNKTVVSEFTLSGNPNVADAGSERIILQLDDPQSNHNGGTLAFGPDGYLYIAIGDGGAADDVAPGHVTDWYTVNQGGNGQDVDSNLFGNILRIDVNGMQPYGVPSDNPYVGKDGRDEIYAYGFRNPYRFSFDMGGSHDLYAGDAGQVLYEEVSRVVKGGNYGWNVKEGTSCFNASNNMIELASCPSVDDDGDPLIDPVIELNNWQNPEGGKATTIIGGNVYRGNSIPTLQGKYIFGTFSQTPTTANGELFMATPKSGTGKWDYSEISLASHPSDIGYYLKGFGQDKDGEIYLMVSGTLGPAGNTGKVFKLIQK